MKLEAGCGIATSEVPKAEKEAQPDSEPWWPQEARAKSKSGSGLETEDKLLRAESGPEAKAESLGAAPRSGSRPEDEALFFVVATEQEFEEVLAIFRDIYSGLDYLPSRYHSWLRDPNRTVVLAKRNGGVLIVLVHVIDARETALVEGPRVAPWERGKGVAGLLQRFCSQLVKRQYPGVKVVRLTRDDQLGPCELKKYRLVTKQVLWVRFNASALLARLGARLAALRTSGTFSPLPTKVLSEAGGDVARLLLSPSVQRDVLPGGTIIQDWQPYQPSESNLRLLAAKDIEWLLDSRARPRVLALCTLPFPIPHGGDCT
ncbi:hypothetical protein PAL_GLEAN10012058 [Pteropus alecto]|uniref:N-acetyltransferase domain-containing protein n=1 Tax=Pteropus alecto TaxID=9402 RepID=L5K5F1_PTEAL|nr:hypothetical protein PAL_GLEAN10012058 [Pteropus alecto]